MSTLIRASAFMAVLIPSLIFAETLAETFVWDAFKSSGKDKVWTNRDGYMGITGNHVSTSGNIWYDAFPGSSGRYSLVWRIGAESDGQPKYEISIGGKVVKSGSFPYPTSGKTCDKAKSVTQQTDLKLGSFDVKKGDKLNIKGTSVYPCGADHGSYCRWKTLTFTKEGSTPVQTARRVSDIHSAKTGVRYNLQGKPLAQHYMANRGISVGIVGKNQSHLLLNLP